MTTFIESHAALTWLAAGLVLLVFEVIAPGVFMMWLGLASIGTGVFVLLTDPPFAWQVVAFGILAAIAVAIGLQLRRARPKPVLNTATSGLVGRSATVLSQHGHELRVRVGDSDWSARLRKGADAPANGAMLRVAGVEGTTLILTEE